MPEYYVRWDIDLKAESPEDAARTALAIMRDPDSLATVFEVIDVHGEITTVDLDAEE